jgi:hypothetical protein
MISHLLIGLLAIVYGLVGLGRGHLTLKDFYWGLIVFGVVYLAEHLYGPIRANLRSRSHES